MKGEWCHLVFILPLTDFAFCDIHCSIDVAAHWEIPSDSSLALFNAACMQHNFLIHLSVGEYLGCFCIMAIWQSVAVNTELVSLCFGGRSQEGRLLVLWKPWSLRFLHTVFHPGWLRQYSHQQGLRVPFAPHLHQSWCVPFSLVSDDVLLSFWLPFLGNKWWTVFFRFLLPVFRSSSKKICSSLIFYGFFAFEPWVLVYWIFSPIHLFIFASFLLCKNYLVWGSQITENISGVHILERSAVYHKGFYGFCANLKTLVYFKLK